jgi:hypothetical protein
MYMQVRILVFWIERTSYFQVPVAGYPSQYGLQKVDIHTVLDAPLVMVSQYLR